MKFVNENNKEFYILHFSGTPDDKYINFYCNIFENIKDRKLNVSNKITICSCLTKNLLNKSLLLKQLNDNSIPCILSDECLKYDSSFFIFSNKIDYNIENLRKVKTEYTLLIDGRDTLILKDLDDNFIDEFNRFNVPFIFNGDAIKHPLSEVEPLYTTNYLGKFKYINSGVIFGKTEELLNFYLLARNIRDNLSKDELLKYKYKTIKFNGELRCLSEQFYLRLANLFYKEGTYSNKIVDCYQNLFVCIQANSNGSYLEDDVYHIIYNISYIDAAKYNSKINNLFPDRTKYYLL